MWRLTAQTCGGLRRKFQVFPTDAAISTFLGWMKQHGLGRKRILARLSLAAKPGLDTLLGATYLSAGITSLMTTNSRDFRIFGVFKILEP